MDPVSAGADVPHTVAAALTHVRDCLATLRDLGAEVSPASRILDFGCGYGDAVKEFRRRGYQADGVDVTPFWGGGGRTATGKPVSPFPPISCRTFT